MKEKLKYNTSLKMRQLRGIITAILKRMRNSVMPVRHYIFKDSESGELFTYVYFGWDRKLCYYWLNRFSENLEKVRSGSRKIASRNISKFLKNNKGKFDLAIIESTHKELSSNYPHSFLLPRWMEMKLDIESSLKMSAIKNINRNIKKYSLKYEVREGIEALDLFYHSMYKPHVLKRHGKSADLASYNYFYNKFRSEECEMFFLIKDNEPVAAAFIEVNKNGYRMSASGIKDGNDEIFKMRVIGALRYFIMHFYYEKGIKTLLVGSCMPVVFDGVTEYKLHLGAKPYLKDLDDRSKYYLIPLTTKPLTVRILKSNPLFYLSGSTLNIALFVSDEDFDTKEEFYKFFNRVKINNVEWTRVFYFNSLKRIIQWINEKDRVNIEYIKYD